VIGFLLNKIAYSVAVLFAVVTAIFGLIHLSGDPTAGFTAPGASPEQQAVIREQFGLDQPLPVQYLTYLERVAQGDFGDSWRARRPAMTAVIERLPATLTLTGTSIALALAVGLPLGTIAASRPGGITNTLASTTALAGQAIPGFFLGTLLILIFAVKLQWLPSSGRDSWQSLILPAIALAAYPTAIISRLIRSSLTETLGQDYIRTAQSKGLGKRAIVLGHALRNALLPTLAFVGLQIGFLLGGAVIIESVFAYPGIGLLALGAVADRDLPVVQAVAIVVAVAIIVINFLVDALARLLDPRLRDSLGGT